MSVGRSLGVRGGMYVESMRTEASMLSSSVEGNEQIAKGRVGEVTKTGSARISEIDLPNKKRRESVECS